MEFHQGQLYHVYNRGNNQQPIFYLTDNYHFFLKKMRVHLLKRARVLAYCLMPNHFHWLVYIRNENNQKSNSINKNIGILLRSYTQAINKKYGRTGSLFQQNTKANELTNREYALTCFYYIHQNPLKAKLVKNLSEWPYSSYPDFADIRNGSLIDKAFTYRYLEISSDRFIEESKQAINPQKIKHIY